MDISDWNICFVHLSNNETISVYFFYKFKGLCVCNILIYSSLLKWHVFC